MIWTIEVDGHAFTSSTMERGVNYSEAFEAELAGEALEQFVARGTHWDELDTERQFTITVSPEST